MNKNQLLFLTILLEGYVVLACELIAIRTLVPFVGSGTEVIAIVISAVLLPLAVGYHAGGQRFQAEQRKRKGKVVSIRKILLKNLLSAMIPLAFGLSYLCQELFFGLLNGLGIIHHIPQTAIFCFIFLVYPVFLLAQTIPLLSNYFSREHLSAITGKMLFFSTMGSFAGSVFSTIVLMMTIGVHYTLVFTIGLLVLIVFMLTRRWKDFDNVIALFMFGFVFLLNNDALLAKLGVVENNQYSIVKIHSDPKNERVVMEINRSMSSIYAENPDNRFGYISFIEETIAAPAIKAGIPKKILVIGAGGFTLGVDDDFNEYTYVDIDASLKETAEKHLLPKPLGKNKSFAPMSARAFLVRDDQTYDAIILDAYTNIRTVPAEVVTYEFLSEAKKHLKDNGVLMSNVISSPAFEDLFTVRYNNTFRRVFPYFTVQLMNPIDTWKEGKMELDNILYIYHHRTEFHEDQMIYTDNLNSYSLDR
ncbi:MAG: fused MFS/spermidine synthase [Rickettsiales bacterium]|nr:fused MFS/spermidine synthase [Rickettsiales bacterium]